MDKIISRKPDSRHTVLQTFHQDRSYERRVRLVHRCDDGVVHKIAVNHYLMENWIDKTGKYFKYAIGEIILVVIGILIALWINNLNLKRYQRIEEISILKELKKDLLKDKVDFQLNMTGYKAMSLSIDNVLKAISP